MDWNLHMKNWLLVAFLVTATHRAFAANPADWVDSQTAAHTLHGKQGQTLANATDLSPTTLVDITVSLKLRNRAMLDNLTSQIHAGKTGERLNRNRIASDFAPTTDQVNQVTDYLTQAGFTNIRVADNRLLVFATGNNAAIQAAFNTKLLHAKNEDGRDVHANVSKVQIPAALKDIVLGVQGLQNVDRFHIHTLTGQIVSHDPTDLPIIYNANGLPSAANTVVGILSQGDLTQTLLDLKTYASKNMMQPVSTLVVRSGGASSDTTNAVEWALDSQTILATAGGAVRQMIFYDMPTLDDAQILRALNTIVSDNAAQIINMSLGSCELVSQQDGTLAAAEQLFQLGTAQGQTFVAAAGDSGASNCGSVPGASYPASSAYVVAVGGTDLYTNGNTAYGYEGVWKLSGGAISQVVSSGSTFPGTKRPIPDVSFEANGVNFIFNGGTSSSGGTSLSAPIFAGFWARIQSAHNNMLIWPVPKLYSQTNIALPFVHPLQNGSNGYCTANGSTTYVAGCGFGSLDIGKFEAEIAKTAGY
jgi:pseudomonalisin/xanthomonalisin